MTTTVRRSTGAGPAAGPSPQGVADRLASVVAPLFGGRLPVRIRAWDGSVAGAPGAPTVVLASPDVLRRLVFRPGELGLAQAYVSGELDLEGDLLDGLRLGWQAVRDGGVARPSGRVVIEALRSVRAVGLLGLPPAAPASQARLRGRLHSRGRDRAAISHHYDLSNDFYSLILDPTLAYSCAYWRSEDVGYTLGDAQRDKLDLVCRKLGLGPGVRLLDIGCGWGSLSLHAAQHHGAQVVGVTISAEQKAFVDRRVREHGLEDRVDIRLQDYREIADRPFDAVGSIEMSEHVGDRNYPAYARTLHRLTRPGGRVLVQAMSRRSRPGGGPFIEAFIAPDMSMRPVGRTVQLLEDGGLEVRDVHALREHYVRTVQAWYETFEEHWDAVVAMVGEEVGRVWRLYLVGGALAFEEGRMGVDQILAVRPGADGDGGMPPVRDW